MDSHKKVSADVGSVQRVIMFVLWRSMFVDDPLTASFFEILHFGHLEFRPSLPDRLPPCDKM